jgi:L,D-transpeptidase YcbB
VMAHSQPSYSRPAGYVPPRVSFASDNSGPSFFDRLFGGPRFIPGPPPGRRPPGRIFER